MGAAIAFFFALCVAAPFFFPAFRQKLNLAATILKTVSDIGRESPSVYVFSILGKSFTFGAASRGWTCKMGING